MPMSKTNKKCPLARVDPGFFLAEGAPLTNGATDG